MAKDTLTMQEVSDKLGVGLSTIYRLIEHDSDFRTFKFGGRRLIQRSTLDAYIAKREQAELEERALA